MIRNSIVKSFFLAGLITVVAACTPQTQTSPTEVPTAAVENSELTVLTVSGSSTGVSIMEALQPAFEKSTSSMRLRILEGAGNAGSLDGVKNGQLDLALRTRPLEKDAQGVGGIDIGRSAVGVFVHPDNGVTSISKEALIGIFSGKIHNWKEVGGADLPVVVYVREPDESNTEIFRDTILGDTAFPASAQVTTSSVKIISAVAGTRGGIGYGGWTAVVSSGAKVAALSIDGAGPTDIAYPMFTPLSLVYTVDNQKKVQVFLDWISSEAGRNAVKNIGATPIT